VEEPPETVEVGLAVNVHIGGVLATTPVPLRLIVFGLLAALLVMTKLLRLAPACDGEKVTSTLQLAPCAKVAPQLVVRAKSPFATILTMFRTLVPVFERVTVLMALFVPTS
jgi:hypothetical protein